MELTFTKLKPTYLYWSFGLLSDQIVGSSSSSGDNAFGYAGVGVNVGHIAIDAINWSAKKLGGTWTAPAILSNTLGTLSVIGAYKSNSPICKSDLDWGWKIDLITIKW
jgi:hypothetical protein